MPLDPSAISEIYPFGLDASETTGDIISLDDYLASPTRRTGHPTGIARRNIFNRTSRQTAHMASGLAQFIANRYTPGVKDDGDLDKIEEGIAVACGKVVSIPTIRKYTAVATAHQRDIIPGFTLDQLSGNVALYISGLKQTYNSYTISPTTITLSEDLNGGEILEVLSVDLSSVAGSIDSNQFLPTNLSTITPVGKQAVSTIMNVDFTKMIEIPFTGNTTPGATTPTIYTPTNNGIIQFRGTGPINSLLIMLNGWLQTNVYASSTQHFANWIPVFKGYKVQIIASGITVEYLRFYGLKDS